MQHVLPFILAFLLGSNDFATRQTADDVLSGLGFESYQALSWACKSKDIERAYRANKLIERFNCRIADFLLSEFDFVPYLDAAGFLEDPPGVHFYMNFATEQPDCYKSKFDGDKYPAYSLATRYWLYDCVGMYSLEEWRKILTQMIKRSKQYNETQSWEEIKP